MISSLGILTIPSNFVKFSHVHDFFLLDRGGQPQSTFNSSLSMGTSGTYFSISIKTLLLALEIAVLEVGVYVDAPVFVASYCKQLSSYGVGLVGSISIYKVLKKLEKKMRWKKKIQ